MIAMTRPTSHAAAPLADRFEDVRPDAARAAAPAGFGAAVAGWRSAPRRAAAPTTTTTLAAVPARSPEDEFEECERWDGLA